MSTEMGLEGHIEAKCPGSTTSGVRLSSKVCRDGSTMNVALSIIFSIAGLRKRGVGLLV
jgi:hypothetical protein